MTVRFGQQRGSRVRRVPNKGVLGLSSAVRLLSWLFQSDRSCPRCAAPRRVSRGFTHASEQHAPVGRRRGRRGWDLPSFALPRFVPRRVASRGVARAPIVQQQHTSAADQTTTTEPGSSSSSARRGENRPTCCVAAFIGWTVPWSSRSRNVPLTPHTKTSSRHTVPSPHGGTRARAVTMAAHTAPSPRRHAQSPLARARVESTGDDCVSTTFGTATSEDGARGVASAVCRWRRDVRAASGGAAAAPSRVVRTSDGERRCPHPGWRGRTCLGRVVVSEGRHVAPPVGQEAELVAMDGRVVALTSMRRREAQRGEVRRRREAEVSHGGGTRRSKVRYDGGMRRSEVSLWHEAQRGEL